MHGKGRNLKERRRWKRYESGQEQSGVQLKHGHEIDAVIRYS